MQKDTNAVVVSLNPGICFGHHLPRIRNPLLKLVVLLISPVIHFICKNCYYASQTSVYCSLEDSDKLVKGGYYSDCKYEKCNSLAVDLKFCEKLWKFSEESINKVMK